MGWISPTGFNDPSGTWEWENRAYDGLTVWPYLAYEDNWLSGGEWGNFIELTHASVRCTIIKFCARNFEGDMSSVDIDIYYSGAWHDLYQGSFDECWLEKSFSAQYITKVRFRFYSIHSTGIQPGLWEVYLYKEIVAPTVTGQAITDITYNSGTGNGNITDTGGENTTKRGFCWNTTGSPTVADDKVEEEGSFGTGAFTGAITDLDPNVLYYVRAYAYNSAGYGYSEDVQFTTNKNTPTVTAQAPTDILPTTVTANGNIISDGGVDCTVRGFKYGLTKTDTWDAHDEGAFNEGAYTKGLVDLSPNTTYWIQAYATNSEGTSYSEWIEFQTAASGTIPTGTRIFICSDYSGYTYKLMRSETDDGEPYTAYFVISTDLSNKQALAIYKRVLDLHLYFKSEDSGNATIEVKRDSEAEWQAVGTVSLTGTAEIIVKHLATRIFAKHFLFKTSAANRFRFLGCLFEFLPGGMR